MIAHALMTILLLLFGVGVLEFYDNRVTWSQAWRGLATMWFSLVGMVLVLIEQGTL